MTKLTFTASQQTANHRGGYSNMAVLERGFVRGHGSPGTIAPNSNGSGNSKGNIRRNVIATGLDGTGIGFWFDRSAASVDRRRLLVRLRLGGAMLRQGSGRDRNGISALT